MQMITSREAVQKITASDVQQQDLETVESALAALPDDSVLTAQFQNILRSVRNGLNVNVIIEDKELTPQQAADLLQVSRPHVLALVKRGELTAHSVGSNHRIPQSEVLDMLARKTQASRDVASAFANRDASKRALVARAVGVDPEIARELGY
jgi:excisionase family DNA binding protein